MEIRPHRRIVLPLDYADPGQAIDMASDLHQHVGVVKIGLQLFTAAGTSLLDIGESLGLDVFLDLKLHDIPNTVGKAIAAMSEYGVNYTTVHTAGGSEMLRAAVKNAPSHMMILGVTVLTSVSNQNLLDLGIGGGVEYNVMKRVEVALEAGVKGLVCSPLEVAKIRENLGHDVKLVVPGIRPEWAQKNDQKRVSTPKDAMEAGADLLVIGRPITQADDPQKACQDIAEEIRPFS
ncbi:MAG: orotidine-5'-phosphate decarboxylase [bacterium]